MATSPDASPLFHVEEQEVLYWRTAVDAPDKEAARTLVTNGSGTGEVVGKTLVSRLVTNVHQVTDHCADMGCYDFDHEEREGL
jgi:hypothetical protein